MSLRRTRAYGLSPLPSPRQQNKTKVASSKPAIIRTHDNNQKKFYCDTETLLHWRNALWIRYRDLHGDCRMSWEDRAGPKTRIKLPGVVTSLPNDLTQTKCQVHYGENKCITVTLYFKKLKNGGGGTCLIQGLMCGAWVHFEVEALSKIVENMASSAKQHYDNSSLSPPISTSGATKQQALSENPSLDNGNVGGSMQAQLEIPGTASPGDDGGDSTPRQGLPGTASPGDDGGDSTPQQGLPGTASRVDDVPAQPPTFPVGTQTTDDVCQTCNGLSMVVCGGCLLETINDGRVQQDKRIAVLIQAHQQEVRDLREVIDSMGARLRAVESRNESLEGKCKELLKRTKPLSQQPPRHPAPASASPSPDGGQHKKAVPEPLPTSEPSESPKATSLQQQSESDSFVSPTSAEQLQVELPEAPTPSHPPSPPPQSVEDKRGEETTTSDSPHPIDARRQSESSPPPAKKLPSLRLPRNTKHVLLGDSNLSRAEKRGLIHRVARL